MTSFHNSSPPPFNISYNHVTLFPPEDDHSSDEDDLISADQYNLVLKFAAAVKMVICIGGIGFNVVTIRIFFKMGLNDSVTIGFFNLAISDLNVLVSTLGIAATMVCQILEKEHHIVFKVPLLFVSYTCICYGRLFTFATTYLITFLAIQRCLCVVRPLQFKGIFTRYRALVVISVIWGYCLVNGGFIMGQFTLKRETILNSNSTIIVMTFTPIYRWVRTNLSVLNGIVLNACCQTIVLVCVCVMAHGLRKSFHFRQSASSRSHEIAESEESKANDANAVSKANVNNSKEQQAIVQVSIMSTIFLVTCVPFMIISIARLRISDLGPYKKYHNTYYTILAIRFTLESVNSAVNFFIYYKYNTKFRKLLSK